MYQSPTYLPYLGSASWITDAGGNAAQHLQYLPYGEDFINQRNTGFDARYKFTGKDKDAETGYQYFGARYYNSDISVWLSVDPMSDEYPSTSPYMYVRGNPIKLIDPNGMWDVEPDDPPTNNNNTNTSNEGVTPEAIVSSFNNEFLNLVEFYVDNERIENIEDMSKLAGEQLIGEEGSELEGLKAAISQVAVQYDYEESAEEWVKEESGDAAQMNETHRVYESCASYIPNHVCDEYDCNYSGLLMQSIRVSIPNMEIKDKSGDLKPVTHMVFTVTIVLIPIL